MPERREFRSRERKSGIRNPNLIVIASEGSNTEPQYFEGLKEKYTNTKIHVEILPPRENTKSAPKFVLGQLDDFRRTYKLNEDDQLWLVFDLDRWEEEEISEVCKLAHQKGYSLAVSNPCFELWLLLHHRDLTDYSEEIKEEFRKNFKDGTPRTRLNRELLEILGRYNSTNIALEDFLPFVEIAIERARKIDTGENHRWPTDLGSKVYRLAEQIVNNQKIRPLFSGYNYPEV